MDCEGTTGFEDLASGDRSACERFVREQYEGVFRWFAWMTGNRDSASDLTQETWVQFWHSLSRTVPSASPRVWLYSIGRNVWRKHCRRQKKFRRQENELPDDVTGSDRPDPYVSAEQGEFARALRDEVQRLKPEFREALTLRMWQDMDYQQIAEIQGITAVTARWRVHEAKKLLRKSLKPWQLQEESHGA